MTYLLTGFILGIIFAGINSIVYYTNRESFGNLFDEDIDAEDAAKHTFIISIVTFIVFQLFWFLGLPINIILLVAFIIYKIFSGHAKRNEG